MPPSSIFLLTSRLACNWYKTSWQCILFFLRLPLYSKFISMWVIVYCPFLHSLAVCPPTGCASNSVWVPVWQMIPGKCGRAKLCQGKKAGYLSDPFPTDYFSSNRDLCHVKITAVRVLHLHRYFKHLLDLQVCDVPHHGKYSSITPPRANARFLTIAWAEEEQSFHLVHTNGDIWGEPSICKLC